MRPRKGQKNRPHFAHINPTPNCSPESALHFGFKELLYISLLESIDKNMEVNMSWKCQSCDDRHFRNLIKKSVEVRKEFSFGVCRPDISLFDKNGKFIIAIEIVVSHAPEKIVIDYYKKNKVTLIMFKLDSHEDINQVFFDILLPTHVDVCLNPKCTKCGNATVKNYLYIIKGACWSCRDKIKIAAMVSIYGRYSVDAFNKVELELASTYGVDTKRVFSETTSSTYRAHICRKCDFFIGRHFLYSEYILQALYDDKSYDKYDAGYRCIECE
ncbi:hypothetical protein BK127_39955 [Paenibacillus sp. FSL H7-0331]|nr:hypothetical protein BK127_39955 [Paenibacillus sp. FSL H7-0331]